MAAKKKTPDGISFSPRYIPKDIMKILLKKQSELQAGCVCKKNRQDTIYRILKFVEDKDINQ